MKTISELLIKRLEREWRLLDPDRLKVDPPSMETPSEDFTGTRRIKVKRFDEAS